MVVADMMCCFEESTMATSEKNSLLIDDGSCCCKEAKHHEELVDYNCLPNFLKHNEFILGYYRSEWPMKQTILSIFSIHNETLNVWTHLIGFFVFLALIICTAMMVPMDASMATPSLQHSAGVGVLHLHLTSHAPSTFNMSRSQANQTGAVQPEAAAAAQSSITRWPFYAYLCGAMFCMLMSSACHLLSCHSEHSCYVMLRLDYAGISALIVTSFYPLVYYSFACDPFFQTLYLGFITVFGVATILASLAPVFETPEFRFVRSGLFACMGVSGLVPILHKTIAFGDRPEAAVTTGYEMVMGLFYGLGVVVYAARIPERWMPGKFDLVGHSHQLFHVLVIAGAYTHYLAGSVYLSWREAEGC